MSEADLLKFTTSCLKASGLLWWRVANGAIKHGGVLKKSPIKGFPDLAGVTKEGHFWALELKVGRNKLSVEQVDWVSKLKANGVLVEVLKTPDQVINFITVLSNKNQPL